MIGLADMDDVDVRETAKRLAQIVSEADLFIGARFMADLEDFLLELRDEMRGLIVHSQELQSKKGFYEKDGEILWGYPSVTMTLDGLKINPTALPTEKIWLRAIFDREPFDREMFERRLRGFGVSPTEREKFAEWEAEFRARNLLSSKYPVE